MSANDAAAALKILAEQVVQEEEAHLAEQHRAKRVIDLAKEVALLVPASGERISAEIRAAASSVKEGDPVRLRLARAVLLGILVREDRDRLLAEALRAAAAVKVAVAVVERSDQTHRCDLCHRGEMHPSSHTVGCPVFDYLHVLEHVKAMDRKVTVEPKDSKGRLVQVGDEILMRNVDGWHPVAKLVWAPEERAWRADWGGQTQPLLSACESRQAEAADVEEAYVGTLDDADLARLGCVSGESVHDGIKRVVAERDRLLATTGTCPVCFRLRGAPAAEYEPYCASCDGPRRESDGGERSGDQVAKAAAKKDKSGGEFFVTHTQALEQVQRERERMSAALYQCGAEVERLRALVHVADQERYPGGLAEEREACARVADKWRQAAPGTAHKIAEEIRARGSQPGEEMPMDPEGALARLQELRAAVAQPDDQPLVRDMVGREVRVGDEINVGSTEIHSLRPILRLTTTGRVGAVCDSGEGEWFLDVRVTRASRDVYAEIAAERARAVAKHGETSMEASAPLALRRLTILLEEVGEIAKEYNDADNQKREVSAHNVRTECIQVAAMAAAWADALSGCRP